MITHCTKCDGIEFPDISSLRKHQWKEHKNIFKNTGKPLSKKAKWTKERRARQAETIAKRNGHHIPNSVRGFLNGVIKPEMSAIDVLERLKEQRDFMNDIVDMVEGMIK